ncbi:MAG: putative transport system permease protein [Thermoanaerobaculia bacterium]|jgi:putative ABC transport system permease protein|nr:putative transport system permease protein [Thermoanaerobaculia bacterium]
MIPIKYNIGNLTSRRVSTVMTVIGIGVVIAVMISMMALQNGVNSAVVSSGSKDNLMVMREGAAAELSSWVTKDAFRIIRAMPGIAKDGSGGPMISPELVIIFKIPKKDDPKGSNVSVRGVTPAAFVMRPYIKLVEGRMFRPGVNEVIVARRIRDRFVNTGLGDQFQFGATKYNVVGVFDAQGTAFDSEMWCDADFLGQARKRDAYSSVILRPVDRSAFESIKAAIKDDNRLKLDVKTEYQYYADQSNGLAGIVILVGIVSFFMTIGAILGTMNTMFSAIASRGRELATMRALGFKRRAILFSVVIESAFISLLGGVAGLLLAIPVNAISTGTTNFVTFSEVAFNFRVDWHVGLTGIIVALIAGIIGGALPAISAARMPITRALREI